MTPTASTLRAGMAQVLECLSGLVRKLAPAPPNQQIGRFIMSLEALAPITCLCVGGCRGNGAVRSAHTHAHQILPRHAGVGRLQQRHRARCEATHTHTFIHTRVHAAHHTHRRRIAQCSRRRTAGAWDRPSRAGRSMRCWRWAIRCGAPATTASCAWRLCSCCVHVCRSHHSRCCCCCCALATDTCGAAHSTGRR